MKSLFRRIVNLLEPRERWQLAGLFALMLAVAFLQTVGVASILPFMSVVSDPGRIQESDALGWLFTFVGFESVRPFLILFGVLVLALMALSNFTSAFEHYLMSRFVWRTQHRLSVRLLRRYLDQPYTFYLQQNTAGLAKNILTEVSEVVQGMMMPGLRLLSQGLVVFFVLSLLLIVDAKVALSAAVILGGAYGLIYAYVRPRQRRLGQVRRSANYLRFKTADEALGSIKETKVLGREPEFLKRFAAANRRFSNANSSNVVVRDMPRFALDTLAFGGIVVIVLYLVGTRDNFGEAVAVVSLYALAGYRMLPALQQVFKAMSMIRFYLPALDGLEKDLQRGPAPAVDARAPSERAAPAVSFERRIAVRGIGFRYPGGETDVLKDITLDIPKNTSVAFVGSTGSGKTTMVDILLGLLEPQRGSLCVDNLVLAPADMPAWRKKLGYVPQNIYLCDDTVTRNIALGVPDAEIDHAAVERAARVAHLHDFVCSLPDGYDTVVGERGVRLSGGQRQRIGIARSLYTDPDVLIMDEATSALDGVTEDAVIQAIRELASRKTIILVAHRLTTVRECDSIHLFENGEIVTSGSYHELLSSSLQFRAMASGGVEGLAAG